MECLQQSQAPHISYIYEPSRPDRIGRRLKHPHQVLYVGEVLHDGVEDDRIEVGFGNGSEIIGGGLQEADVCEPAVGTGQQVAEIAEGGGGEISGQVTRAMRSYAKQQEACAAADFENGARVMGEDAVDGLVNLLAHLDG